MSDFDNDALAGAASPGVPETTDSARTIFPMSFDRDYMDFRPEEVDEQVVAPKGASAPVSVSAPALTTGLEDVSSDDLQTPSTPETTVPTSAATGSSKANPPETGKPTS